MFQINGVPNVQARIPANSSQPPASFADAQLKKVEAEHAKSVQDIKTSLQQIRDIAAACQAFINDQKQALAKQLLGLNDLQKTTDYLFQVSRLSEEMLCHAHAISQAPIAPIPSLQTDLVGRN